MQESSLTKALLEAQKDFPLIKKTENNPFFKSKYASLPNILEVVLPILQKNGILLSQVPISENDKIGVRTVFIHAESGQKVEGSFYVSLAKNDPQGAGSAITYCRRYALVSMLGLNVDEDDDGNSASHKEDVPTIRR